MSDRDNRLNTTILQLDGTNQMRNKLLPPTILCLLLTMCIAASLAFAQNPGKGETAKFEYKVIYALSIVDANTFSDPDKAAAKLQGRFNEFGEGGWELCQEMDGLLTFKRRK